MSVSVIANAPLCSMLLGLQARLQIAFPASLFHFDVMPARITPQSWAQTVKRTPFIGLGWNAAHSTPGRPFFTGPAHFSVFLVAGNVNGERARLFGDAVGPGLFDMVSAAALVLTAFKIPDLRANAALGATVGTCMPSVASNAAAEWSSDNISVAVMDVEVAGLALTVGDCLTGAEATPDALLVNAFDWAFGEAGGDQAQLADQFSTGA